MKYKELVGNIEELHHSWFAEATKSINVALTLRNWMIRYYIVEYQQDGEDRAAYGAGLLQGLEDQLKPSGIKGMNVRAFRNYRKLYQVYPTIRGLLTTESTDSTLQSIIPIVLIDLKVAGFSHENAGQLNTYINYYKAEVKEQGDNPPIGILFVTDKNKALVEYDSRNGRAVICQAISRCTSR